MHKLTNDDNQALVLRAFTATTNNDIGWDTVTVRFTVTDGDAVVPVRSFVHLTPGCGELLDDVVLQVGHIVDDYMTDPQFAAQIASLEQQLNDRLLSQPGGTRRRLAMEQTLWQQRAPGLVQLVRRYPLLAACDGRCFKGLHCWHD